MLFLLSALWIPWSLAELPAGLDADDPGLRLLAYRDLGQEGGVPALEQLAEALREEHDPGLREAARHAMERLDLSLDELADALQSEAPEARAWAAYALGRYPGLETTQLLAEALQDESEKVREQAYASLEQGGDRSALSALQRAAVREPSRVLRQRAQAAALTVANRHRAGLDVGGDIALLQGAALEQRVSAARRLGESGDWRALHPLLDAATSGPSELREAAMTSLGHLGDRRASPALQAWAETELGSLRYAAIAALAWLGDDSSRPTLERLLGSEDVRTRAYAVRALSWHAHPGLAEAIAPALQDADEAVRTEALDGLSRSLSPSACALLVQALEDPSPFLRAEAARLLGLSGYEEGLEPLLEVLGDRDPLVQLAAAQALARLGQEQAIPPLQALRDRERDPERKALFSEALEALGGG